MTNQFNDADLSIITSLNEAYNNNLRSIQNFTNSINDLTDMNVQIHNRIVDILNIRNSTLDSVNNRENINRSNININNSNTTSTNTERNNLGRVIFNNIPYIIDSVQQYRIPSRSSNEETRTNNISNLLQRFFLPIEIFPTQTQIEAATRNVRYCDILNPINRSCPISLEHFSDNDSVTVIRHCGHIFNQYQLNTWFRSNCRCPVCRYDIRNYNSNSSIFFDTSNNVVDEQERNVEEPLHNRTNNISNENAAYFDLFFSDNSLLNNFSTLSDATDPTALVNLLRAVQRRSNT